MQEIRYHLLKSNIINHIHYLDKKELIEKEILKINKNAIVNDVSCNIVLDLVNQLYLSVYLHKNKIFIGIYNKAKNTISFSIDIFIEKIKEKDIEKISLRLNNAIVYSNYANMNEKVLNAWKKAIPLLDKVIDIEENYEKYKKEYNQYKELNIPNNGFIGDKEDYINQCVFLFECYQTINDSKTSIDFNSMSIFKDNIPYISIKEGQIQNNFDKTEIKNSLNKLVEEYIDTLQNEIQNQFNLLHKEQGLVPITNFKGQYCIYNIKNDKDKNIFHYEIENDNINQLLDCKMRLSELRQELLKEQQKSIAYEDMDSIENETENNIDDI